MVDRQEYEATLTAVGIDPDGLQALEADGSLLPEDRILDVELPALASKLTIQGALGEGGQALVELARQAPLGREVAVKRPTSDPRRKGIARTTLIVEGRICGQLEHPNIIPVYDLGVDERGEVVLVMKRVRGEVWNARLEDPDVPLSFHLHVLQEVCRAVHFAHEHGVLHRDLKPANVMIGETGQVYVLDWGLAVALDERAPRGVPRQNRTTGVVGSPGYLAPEMAWPRAELDPRADVFQLGNLLYRVLAGHAPYSQGDLKNRLLCAVNAEAPPLPPSTPDELVEICARARRREKAQRFQSAEELRLALVAFDAHASARQLAKEGGKRLGELRRLGAGEDDDQAAARLYTEARFAFAQALDVWPESTVAHAGAQQALQLMILRELERGRHSSAQRLAHELDAPMADVEEALERARQQQEELVRAAARVEELEKQQNFRLGAKARATLVAALSFAWATFQVASGAAVKKGWVDLATLDLAWSNLVLLVGGAVGFLVFQKRVAENKAGRRVALSLLACVAAISAQWFILAGLGVSPFQGMALVHVLIATGFFWMSTQDRVWRISAIVSAGSVPFLVVLPAWALELNGAVVAIAFLSVVWPEWRAVPAGAPDAG